MEGKTMEELFEITKLSSDPIFDMKVKSELVEAADFVAEDELMVSITLNEYRRLNYENGYLMHLKKDYEEAKKENGELKRMVERLVSENIKLMDEQLRRNEDGK